MVEQIEALRAELQPHGFAETEVLEQRQVNRFNARSADQIASFIPELSGLGLWIQLLESRTAHPLVWCVRPGVRIADDIRPAGEEAGDFRRGALQRHVRAVVHSEWGSGSQVH